ncbi:MAG: hypothetical protein FD180_4510 [Planctomycetota bacterium]|nr:MAG: hypothetical protein FD180_4510 [Planctomycetota bacterium]
MTLQLSWRGRLADPGRIDSFEDALLEVALEFGGQFHPLDPEDHARGGLLDLSPGLGRIPFAVQRDGRLATIQGESAATDGWISVPAHFATAEGHSLLVEVLEALCDAFLPGLEIRDDAGYAGAHDAEAFLAARARSGAEASPFKPAILRRRVRAVIDLPEQKRPSIGKNDPEGTDSRVEGTEAEWDAFYRRNLRRNAGLRRSIEMSVAGGEEHGTAFEEALRSEGITELPGMEVPEEGPGGEDDDVDEEQGWDVPDEVNTESPAAVPHELRFPPLVERSQDVVCQAMDAVKGSRSPLSPANVLCAGVLEMAGGLSQAISDDDEESELDTPFGLIVVQLKRALRGVEFALGALPACREGKRAETGSLERIEKELRVFQDEILARLATARVDWARDKGGRV